MQCISLTKNAKFSTTLIVIKSFVTANLMSKLSVAAEVEEYCQKVPQTAELNFYSQVF